MHMGFYDERCWRVDHVLSPELFYLALPCILEEGTVIYFNSFSERKDSVEFLDPHLAPAHLIEPVETEASSEPFAWSRHCLYTPAMQKGLADSFAAWNATIADNIVCYRRGELLLWFHDALAGGELHLAARYTKDEVAQFCAAMSPRFEAVLPPTEAA